MIDLAYIAPIILSVATLITSIGAVIASLRNHKNIQAVQRQTNGLMEEMKSSAEARGNLQGRADERSDQELRVSEPVKVEITKIPKI